MCDGGWSHLLLTHSLSTLFLVCSDGFVEPPKHNSTRVGVPQPRISERVPLMLL
jgi:hypothetical protein